ncbi:MAG: hypothetical protein ACTSUT_08060 [Promethearchaeota archaeon]
MQLYFFIDTSLIIGYCNPSDRLHEVCVSFFRDLEGLYPHGRPNVPIFLLYSIQIEYRYKVQKVYDEFIARVKPFLMRGSHNERSLKEIEKHVLGAKTEQFDKYIIILFKEKNIRIVNIINLISILNSFHRILLKNFSDFTQKWIKRPLVRVFPKTRNDPIYNTYFNLIKSHIHYPDSEHLALAAHEVCNRNTHRGTQNYEYGFYTDDNEWIRNGLEGKINILNFKIKKIQYKEKYKLGFNKNTQSFNLKKVIGLEYLPGHL